MSRDPYSPTWPWEPHEMAAIKEALVSDNADYDAGLRRPWVVTSDGGSWSITSTSGDVIASEIPHGVIADYIADLHNTRVTPPAEGKS